jgi:hypothetical protein
MTLAEEDGAEDKLIQSLVGEAVKAVFARYAKVDDFERIIEQFLGNLTFPAGDDLSADEFVANMKAVKSLPQSAAALAKHMELDGCGRHRWWCLPHGRAQTRRFTGRPRHVDRASLRRRVRRRDRLRQPPRFLHSDQ